MRKLTLDLDALAVDSFTTAPSASVTRGTVAAREHAATPLCVPDTWFCGTRTCTGNTFQNC